MKQLKRLDAVPQDPYQRARRSLLRHFEMAEDAFRRLERERPDRIVTEGDAMLAASLAYGVFTLNYAFPNRDAFARLFPDMLARMLPVLGQDEAPFGVRLRLTEASSRPYVEPILIAQAFELSREWLRMTLADLPDEVQPDGDVAPGFVLRPARPDDAEDIAAIDAAAFPISWNTPDAVRAAISDAVTLRVLEETSSGRVVGFLKLRTESPVAGYISDIALHPDHQRRGLGQAMMRWALGTFHAQGLRRAALTVSTDNAPAIALYRKLGFVASESGLDYRRPLDEDEVRQVLDKHRASHIRIRRLL